MVHSHVVLVERPGGGRAVPEAEAVIDVCEIYLVVACRRRVQISCVYDYRARSISITGSCDAREAKRSLEPHMSAFMHAPPRSCIETTNGIGRFLDIANHRACATHYRAGPLEKSLIVNRSRIPGLTLMQDGCTR